MKVPDIDEETLKRLPEWHRILRDIYAGVESDENRSRSAGAGRNQEK
jgi:hypothetical protein